MFGKHSEPYEFAELAAYNGEKARGIVHTPEWDEKMKQEQERFNQYIRAKAEREGFRIIEAAE